MKFVPKVSYSTFQEMNNSLQQEQGNQSATELGGKTRTRSSNKQHSLLSLLSFLFMNRGLWTRRQSFRLHFETFRNITVAVLTPTTSRVGGA